MPRRAITEQDIVQVREALGIDTKATSRVGERLRALREELGLSLDELAQLVGMRGGRGVVYRWEAGQSLPPFELLLALADLYGVSLDYLAGREGAEKESPAVRAGRKLLQESLIHLPVRGLGPTQRLRVLYDHALKVAPGAFPPIRLTALATLSIQGFQDLLEGRAVANRHHLLAVSTALGVPLDWFYERPQK